MDADGFELEKLPDGFTKIRSKGRLHQSSLTSIVTG